MIHLYAKRPAAVVALHEDAVASLIEVTYAGVNPPAVNFAARAAARSNLNMLADPYLRRDPNSVNCRQYAQLLPLTIYALAKSSHLRVMAASIEGGVGRNDSRMGALVALTNSAYRACGSLEAAMNYDYKKILESKQISIDDAFDLVIWSLLFVEAQLVPGLELPAAARDFPPALWRYLDNYPLIGANAYPDGAWNERFIDTAYLATHIAYIPTGNHRHPIYVEDSPKLYRFLRENLYAVLQMGELDLVAEFVDSLRQYGCTEENDLQVRDGTRYLLRLFHAGGDRWMTYREPGETDDDVDDYDLVHKAWTGIAGVRVRVPELAEPDTYGGVVRRWLPYPR